MKTKLTAKKYTKKLRKSVFKIGIQKNGILTKMSLSYIQRSLKTKCKRYEHADKVLSNWISTLKGITSIHFIRNSDLAPLVANGLLDIAIVGTDMIEETKLDNRISKVKNIGKDLWGLYYMTAHDRPVKLKDAKVIGTPYPRIAKKILRETGNHKAHILKVDGSSELLPWLKMGDLEIDGVLDISVSGKTAANNGLCRMGQPYRLFKSVLIANSLSLKDKSKTYFFERL